MFAAVQMSGINKKIKAKNNLRQAVTNQGIQSLYRDCNNQTNMTDNTKIDVYRYFFFSSSFFFFFFFFLHFLRHKYIIFFLLNLKYNLKSTWKPIRYYVGITKNG